MARTPLAGSRLAQSVARLAERIHERAGTPLIVAPLLVLAVLSLGLAVLSVETLVGHREAAAQARQRFLESYIAQLIERTNADISYRLLVAQVTLTEYYLARGPERARLRPEVLAVGLRNAEGLAAATFLVDAAELVVEPAEAVHTLPAADLLRSQLLARPRGPAPLDVAHFPQAAGRSTVLYSIPWLPDARRIALGLSVSAQAAARRIANTVAGDLGETHIGPGSTVPERLGFLRISDEAGRVLHVQGDPGLMAQGVARSYPEEVSPLLGGMRVELAMQDPGTGEGSSLTVIRLNSAGTAIMSLLWVLLAVLSFQQIRTQRRVIAMRTEFVARVSHELRTPLAQIQLYAESLQLGRIVGRDNRRHAMQVIAREARRLTHLIENILSFSRGTPARAPGDRREPRCDAAEVAREAADIVARLAGTERIRIAQDGPAGEAAIDRESLRQVLVNLLDNAVKYDTSGGPIELSIRARGERGPLTISIDDGGPSVPAEQREQVFQAFYRLERDRDSPTPGTGIGLTVVRDLVQRAGGECALGDSPRGGLRFDIHLPLAGPAP